MRAGALLVLATAALLVTLAVQAPLPGLTTDSEEQALQTGHRPGLGVVEEIERQTDASPGAAIAQTLETVAKAEGQSVPDPGPCWTLEDALHAHAHRLGRPPPELLSSLPDDLDSALGCLLGAVHEANRAMDQVFHDAPVATHYEALASQQATTRELEQLVQDRDPGPLLEAAIYMAHRVDQALPVLEAYAGSGQAPLLDFPPILRVSETPTAYQTNYALIVDLEGDDTYNNHAGGIFVAVGTDRHAVESTPGGQRVEALGGGAHAGDDVQDADAVLSSSLAVDLEGDDTFGVKLPPTLLDDENGCTEDPVVPMVGTLGAGIMGVGMLFSLEGSDTYVGRTQTQGAGHILGVGALYSGPGSDTFEAVRAAQGSGLLGGVGVLHDEAGDDAYTSQAPSGGVWNADLAICDDEVRYTQGSSFDRRSGPLLPSWGILADRSGNDEYEAGNLSQGFGQGPGTGLLLDADGDDAYSAQDRAQGASQGRSAELNPQAPGGGGAGVLVDRTGDDSYQLEERGQGWSLGGKTGEPPTGSPAGLLDWALDRNEAIGVLQDRAGQDEYEGPPHRANGVTNTDGTVGLFVDRE